MRRQVDLEYQRFSGYVFVPRLIDGMKPIITAGLVLSAVWLCETGSTQPEYIDRKIPGLNNDYCSNRSLFPGRLLVHLLDISFISSKSLIYMECYLTANKRCPQ